MVNEEMYEEEDDDLPLQYRRLTAHLQTGSADFNRRLSNYLTNHVAMRSALDQAITNAYAQQYPDAPQFAHNQAGYPSPFTSQPVSQAQAQAQAQSHSQSQSQSSPLYQPYPSPGTPGFRPSPQPRSASMSQGTSSYAQTMAAPTSVHSTPRLNHRPTPVSSKSASYSPPDMHSVPQSLQRRSTLAQGSPPAQYPPGHPSRRMSAPVQPSSQLQQMQRQMQQQMSPPGSDGYPNISPFTTSLPPESQMLLGSALDPNDPATAMLMAGSENISMPFNYDNGQNAKARGFTHSFGGMSATLAPSALDMSVPPMQGQHQSNVSMSSAPNGDSTYGMDPSMSDYSKLAQQSLYPSGNSSQGSGAATPGLDSGWDSFINDGSWAENPT